MLYVLIHPSVITDGPGWPGDINAGPSRRHQFAILGISPTSVQGITHKVTAIAVDVISESTAPSCIPNPLQHNHSILIVFVLREGNTYTVCDLLLACQVASLTGCVKKALLYWQKRRTTIANDGDKVSLCHSSLYSV